MKVTSRPNGDKIVVAESRRKYKISSERAETLLTKSNLRGIDKFVETAYVDCSKKKRQASVPPSTRIPPLPFVRVANGGDEVLGMSVIPIHPKESALDSPLRFNSPEEFHIPAFEDPPGNLPLSRRVTSLLKGTECIPVTWPTAAPRDRSVTEINVLTDAESRALSAMRNGEKATAAKLFCLAGCLQYNYGNVELSINAFTKALHLFEEVQDEKGIAFGNNVLGICYFRLKEYKMALIHHKKQEALGSYYCRAVAQINVGVSYAALGELEFADEAFSDALSSAKASKDRMLETIAYGNAGLASLRIGNMRAAQSNLEVCLENCSTEGDKSGAAICLLLLGKLYSLIHDHQHALFYYEHAYRIGGETNNMDTVDIARVSIGIARGNAVIRDAVLQQSLLMGQEHDVETIVNMLPR